MNGQRFLSLACCLFILTVLSHGARAQDSSNTQPSADKEHKIAVLSPNEVPLREVGRLHEKSVTKALGLDAENRINVQDHTLQFLFESTTPGTDSTTCGKRAKHAVEEDSVIAILGPVTSDCTARVLSQDLKVPVLSSLSTATDLSEKNDPFFRTIANDKLRLQTFVDIADDRGIEVDSSIAIYRKSSEYGRGLRGHLPDVIPQIDWSTHAFRWDEVIEDIHHGEVVLSDSFRQEMDHHHTIKTVFVLGSSRQREPLVQKLDDTFRDLKGDPDFVLVGSADLGELPADTWLIGEAEVGTSPNLIMSIKEQNLSEDLFISTFDASIALVEAIRNALRQSGSDTATLTKLRQKLRDELANNRLPSSELHRKVDFRNGEIQDPPKTPIYRISVQRRIDNVNPDEQKSWVGISVTDRPRDHLEGPMTVELIPHGEELDPEEELIGEQVKLHIEKNGEELWQKEVALKSPSTRVTFTPSLFQQSWFPRTFSIGTDKTPIKEHATVDELGWPISYPIAAVLALIGALLYARYQRQREDETERVKSRTVWWYVDRCFAGLIIAFLVIHMGPLLETAGPLSQIPIPQFGSSWWVNAVTSGLLGGWLGLSPIVGLVASVIAALTPLFQS